MSADPCPGPLTPWVEAGMERSWHHFRALKPPSSMEEALSAPTKPKAAHHPLCPATTHISRDTDTQSLALSPCALLSGFLLPRREELVCDSGPGQDRCTAQPHPERPAQCKT